MTSGFAHFDGSHRENFHAGVLLLAMELDDDVKRVVVTALGDALRHTVSLPEVGDLLEVGREARMERNGAGDADVRVDLWFLFRDFGYVILELKAHRRWDAAGVARQVAAQKDRPGLARREGRVRASALLGPRVLCNAVAEHPPATAVICWEDLVGAMKALPTASRITKLVVRHLEAHVAHRTGIEDRSLDDFARATTTVACLRRFLLDCITELGGAVRGQPLFTTAGDGEPNRGNGWAWFGLSVPFVDEAGRRYRLERRFIRFQRDHAASASWSCSRLRVAA